MKIQYGIGGFLAGIMIGLLTGLIEMKLKAHLRDQNIVPFVIGVTVITCMITGTRLGLRMANRRSSR